MTVRRITEVSLGILGILFAVGLFLVGALDAQQQQPDIKTVQEQALRCQSQMLALQADAVAGKILTIAEVKSHFDAANPTLVLNVATFVATPKPADTEKK